MNSHRGHLLASESQPHTLSLPVEAGTGEKMQRKSPARIFRMNSRCGHRCKSAPIWGNPAGMCQADTVSAHPHHPWYDKQTASICGQEGFRAACLPWKYSPHPVPDRRQGINTTGPLNLSGGHLRGMFSTIC